MIDFLIKYWLVMFLAALCLNLPYVVFFFGMFVRGSKGAFNGALNKLGSVEEIELQEGQEIRGLLREGLKLLKSFFGPYIFNMLPAILAGIPLALLYLGALVGFVAWVIRGAVSGG